MVTGGVLPIGRIRHCAFDIYLAQPLCMSASKSYHHRHIRIFSTSEDSTMVTQNVNSEGIAIAWRIHKKGLLPITMKKEAIAIPEPEQGEVLVEVHSAAINPGETVQSHEVNAIFGHSRTPIAVQPC